jgi:hypothetical protein
MRIASARLSMMRKATPKKQSLRANHPAWGRVLPHGGKYSGLALFLHVVLPNCFAAILTGYDD